MPLFSLSVEHQSFILDSGNVCTYSSQPPPGLFFLRPGINEHFWGCLDWLSVKKNWCWCGFEDKEWTLFHQVTANQNPQHIHQFTFPWVRSGESSDMWHKLSLWSDLSIVSCPSELDQMLIKIIGTFMFAVARNCISKIPGTKRYNYPCHNYWQILNLLFSKKFY